MEQSFVYLKDLKKRIDELNAKKEELKEDLVLPAIEMSEKGPILEVNLVTSLKKGFTLHEVISILEEEGAQVLSANYSTSKNRIFYTISSQVDLRCLSCFCFFSGGSVGWKMESKRKALSNVALLS